MIILTDNGSEFVNQSCSTFLAKLGIIHQKSVVYTPQHNEAVERKHRHLLDTARALKLHAGLPNYLWGECLLTATYLSKLMPTIVLKWKTPHEAFFS